MAGKQQKVKACQHCNNLGWSISAWKFGWCVSGHSSLFRKKTQSHSSDEAYKCPRCDKPEGAQEMPEKMRKSIMKEA